MGEPAPTLLLPDSDGLRSATDLLAGGAIIAAPTDTVYGLVAALDQPEALRQLFTAKGRPHSKAIPVLLGDPETARRFTTEPEALAPLAASFWPGALTVVVAARKGLPAEVMTESDPGEPTVALRVPDSNVMRALCRMAGGALAVTSANASGDTPATDAAGVVGAHLPHLAAVVNGGRTPGPLPSTIVSIAGNQAHVLREGVIPADLVTNVWRDAISGPGKRGMIS